MLHAFTRNAIALGLAAAAASGWAAGTVEVHFADPAKFTDGGRNAVDAERTTEALGAKLKSFGKQLPDGQALTVDVLDVDLAGRIEPGSARDDLRVVSGRADWPRIKLRYTLTAAGQTLKSGEDSLVDMNYLERGKPRKNTDGYEYERRMLDDWFKQRFPAP